MYETLRVGACAFLCIEEGLDCSKMDIAVVEIQSWKQLQTFAGFLLCWLFRQLKCSQCVDCCFRGSGPINYWTEMCFRPILAGKGCTLQDPSDP